MTRELWQHDAFSLSAMLAAGRVTSLELLEHFQARIARLNSALNAVVCLSEEAVGDARASARRLQVGEARGPLDGIPVLVKDNLVVRGMPATWGSRLYAGSVADHDELPVELLRNAGAVIVGKTNCPEFTIEGFTANEIFGVTVNPWDPCVTPGGSSGGSVAAVAAGMIPVSIGTDGGGSVRRPAAYTNLVGLKPSIGRIPRGGGLPQLLLDMEVVGPITRSVRDQALLLDALARPDRRDHRSLRFHRSESSRVLLHEPPPLRVLAVEEFDAAPLDAQIRASFRQMVELVASMGHRVETGELPLDIGYLSEHWGSIGQIGLGLVLQREPQMRRLASAKYVEWGDAHHDATHLLEVIESIDALRDRAAQVFESVDVIMTPTCAAMPWPTAIPFPPEIDGRPVGPRGSAVYTGWVNACGHPAISVPGRPSAASMPIGVQFVGDLGEEELLLRLARQVEDRQGWLEQWPAISFSGEA
jgi:aspartyl-tRNA(Asn)/glutamyl-tRNA(Gln) amidotransferase subunit A